jgi:hypothetical protein
MSTDGIHGNGLYGEEYYSAAVVDSSTAGISATTSLTAGIGRRLRTALGGAMSAASSIVAATAHRIRLAASAAILAVGIITGGRGARLWERDEEPSDTWTEPTPGSDLWARRGVETDTWSSTSSGSSTWTKRNAGADPWE